MEGGSKHENDEADVRAEARDEPEGSGRGSDNRARMERLWRDAAGIANEAADSSRDQRIDDAADLRQNTAKDSASPPRARDSTSPPRVDDDAPVPAPVAVVPDDDEDKADWSRDELGLFLGILGLALSELAALVSLPLWQRAIAAVVTTVVGIPLVSVVAPGVNRLVDFLLETRDLASIRRAFERNWRLGRVRNWLDPQRIAIVVLIVVMGFMWTVIRSANQSIVEERLIAASEELAAVAIDEIALGRPDSAMLLALEANRIHPTIDAHGALLTALTAQSSLQLVFSAPDGSPAVVAAAATNADVLVTAHESGSVYAWVDDRPRQLRQSGPAISALAIQRDGAFAIGAEQEGGLFKWPLLDSDGETPLTVVDDPVRDIALSVDAEVLGVITTQSLVFVETTPGGAYEEHDLGSALKAIAPARVSRRFVVGGSGVVAIVEQGRGLVAQFSEPLTNIAHVAFAPNSRREVIFASDTRVWSGDPIADRFASVDSMVGLGEIRRMIVDDASGAVTVTTSLGVTVWEWGLIPEAVDRIDVPAGPLHAALLESGRLAVTSPGNIQVLDPSQAPLRDTVGQLAAARTSDSDAETSVTITGHVDGSVVVTRRPGDPTRLDSIHTTPVDAVAIEPGGDRFLTGDRSGMVVLWLAGDDGAHWWVDWSQALESGVRDLAALGDGRFASGHSDGSVVIWRADGGTLRIDRELETGPPVWAIDYIRSTGLLAVGRDDGVVSLWKAQSGELMATSPTFDQPIRHLAADADGEVLAVATRSGVVSLVDARTLESLGIETSRGLVWALEWSSQGRVLAIGEESDLELFRFEPGEVASLVPLGSPLAGTGANLRGIGVLSELEIVSLDSNGLLTQWDLRLESLRQRVCDVVNRNLMETEMQASSEARSHHSLDAGRTYANFCPEAPQHEGFPDAPPVTLGDQA